MDYYERLKEEWETAKHYVIPEIIIEERGTGEPISIGKVIFDWDYMPFYGNYTIVAMPPEPEIYIYYKDRHIPKYNFITDSII